jgi:hypothetical protein
MKPGDMIATIRGDKGSVVEDLGIVVLVYDGRDTHRILKEDILEVNGEKVSFMEKFPKCKEQL